VPAPGRPLVQTVALKRGHERVRVVDQRVLCLGAVQVNLRFAWLGVVVPDAGRRDLFRRAGTSRATRRIAETSW
jgi:hypothetical protein